MLGVQDDRRPPDQAVDARLKSRGVGNHTESSVLPSMVEFENDTSFLTGEKCRFQPLSSIHRAMEEMSIKLGDYPLTTSKK